MASYTGTKLETADPTKGTLYTTAPAPDPTGITPNGDAAPHGRSRGLERHVERLAA
jgi:hypothetical protein